MKRFPTTYQGILTLIEVIDPVRYGTTRNFIEETVTHSSPYISRGVISIKVIFKTILEKGNDINADLKRLYKGIEESKDWMFLIQSNSLSFLTFGENVKKTMKPV